jgi:hypothetical protein
MNWFWQIVAYCFICKGILHEDQLRGPLPPDFILVQQDIAEFHPNNATGIHCKPHIGSAAKPSCSNESKVLADAS